MSISKIITSFSKTTISFPTNDQFGIFRPNHFASRNSQMLLKWQKYPGVKG